MSTNKTVVERFLEKVDQSGDCWLWKAARLKSGYGRFRWNGKTGRAHRAAYELFIGSIPEGQMVRHSCDNPPCVRWTKHLSLGTNTDNQQDARAKGRHRYGSRNGHSRLTEADVVAIRAARQAGRRLGAIAAEFHVSASNVKHIVNRKTWSHVA